MKIIFFFLLLATSVFAQEKIHFEMQYGEQKDTLYIHSDPENAQYHLLWKGDTVVSEWAYISTLMSAISSMSNFGLYNSFLLSSHAGDGCPSLYRVISLKNDGTWFVSDAFGNCNEFSDFKISGFSKAEWTFPGCTVPKRKKSKASYSINYDKQEFNLKF